MQKILYVANVRMPTEKAHGVQIAKTCEAFAKLGIDVELIVPRRRTSIKESFAAYYGLTYAFPVTKIFTFDVVSWGKIGFLIESLSFALSAALYARRTPHTVIFSRDEVILFIIWLFGERNLVWETHTGAWNVFARFIARRVNLLVAISRGLRDYYRERGISEERMMVAHDAIDLQSFAHAESKESARKRLRLPQDAKIVMYIGRLDIWKGAKTLYHVASLVPDILVVIIGGDEKQVVEASKQYPSIRFLGEHPYRELSDNQQAADVLVLPNTAQDIISVRFTSPLKLFAYMASGIPIVSSDLPSIREVLDETCAFWCKSDDAADLARALKEVFANPAQASDMARIAKERVKGYTWDARAESILTHIP